MAGGGLWRKTLVYFGLADEDDEYYDDVPSSRLPDDRGYPDAYTDGDRGRGKVKPMPAQGGRAQRSQDFDEIFSDDEYGGRQPSPYSRQRGPSLRSVSGGLDQPQVRVQLVIPRSFNDAQTIADKYKKDIPVILNLQQSDTELAKRLIDFASGLTYALDGGMQRVADKVFLLTPRNVEVSAEERQRIMDRGFFNQY